MEKKKLRRLYNSTSTTNKGVLEVIDLTYDVKDVIREYDCLMEQVIADYWYGGINGKEIYKYMPKPPPLPFLWKND